MALKTELTPAFIKLGKLLDAAHEGEWVFASKKVKNKYSNIQPITICKFKTDGDFIEYRGETEDKYINIKTFLNYVSMYIAETEYELANKVDVIGAINDDRNITIDEISYYLKWKKPKEYVELD